MAIAAIMLLVTGAGGFVGRALCAELVRRGVGFRAASRLAGPNRIGVGDIDGRTDWGAALAGIDTMVHLAAHVHVAGRDAGRDRAAFHRVNAEGTLALARQAAAAGVRRFVFLSTIKVNGESTDGRLPFTPDDPSDPQGDYAASKRAAEVGLRSLAAAGPLGVVILRPPLVYGPGVKANFARLVRLVRAGVPLPLGAVDNRRSLIYVGNLVDLLIKVAGHPDDPGGTFLASDGEDLSTPELVRALAAAMDRPVRLLAVPPRLLRWGAAMLGREAAADRLLGSLQMDPSRTHERFGWTPPFSVAEGLRATVLGL